MRLEGRTALVTGGSRGIGKAIASRLAKEGARVTIVGRNSARLETATAQFRAETLQVRSITGDMTVIEDIERVIDGIVAENGRIDILVNNAAIADSAPFLDMTRQQWDRIIHSNLTGPFLVAQTAARKMVDTGGGVVVNISSVSAHGADRMTNYSAAKSGLHSITRDIATELAPFGVRAVTVTPGWVATELVVEHLDADLLHKLRTDFKRVPMKRLLQAQEIAGAVAFVVSDDASGMTGNEVVVDGGALGSVYINTSL
ncbi:SDR family NAD(P)-dependent oxidoreductase [Salinibacterium sp. ZJ450]|uniref:SDR family NAD(P)-dependent oxidoreductase n=1 Tax=Salinibacterium sp. ZJ450 TaxID=2708338 RepID=UPI00141F6C0F|nr:SDR family NAD(P)-dependent oxidoreductase [Salinibacterium sp. ZJ450]